MADNVTQFSVTIPAGTPQAAPVTLDCQLGSVVVERIEVEIPDGCLGAVGFFVAASHQQVLPFRSGNQPNWLVTNGRVVSWALTNQPDSGDWQLVAYNTGRNPHTLTIRFDSVQTAAPTRAPVMIPADLLAG